MNNSKAQFQINNGNGWQTIAEADIIDGVIPPPPNAWTMARAMNKQIIYTGYTPVEVTVAPSGDNQRDTHFAGFAKSLINELFVETEPRNWHEFIVQAEPIIARRAYDLAKHAIFNIGPADLDMLTTEECVQRVPDLPELPEVKE